jgi:hypothetical protein
MAEFHCSWLTSFTGVRIPSLAVGWTNGWPSSFRSFIRSGALRALAWLGQPSFWGFLRTGLAMVRRLTLGADVKLDSSNAR